MRGANLLIVAGAGIAVVGLILRFYPGLLSWFGHLPGDIHWEGRGSRVFIPISSMIVVSVVATIILNVLARLFRGE